MTAEIWKPVVGFEGLYEVSDQGRVRVLSRIVTRPCKNGKTVSYERPGHIMRPGRHTGGYETVSFYRDGEVKCTTVHSTVAAAFIGPRPEGQEVRHRNGIKTDSRAANLQYGTPRDNHADKLTHGTAGFGEKAPNSVLTEEDVIAIRAARGTPQAELAARFGCTFSNISAIQRRVSWKHV